jgi:beta-hydroxylase
MTEAGIGARAFLAAIAAAARLNRRCARLGDPFVYDNTSFPWVGELEREWRTIRGELDSVLGRRDEIAYVQDIIAGAGSITRDAGWKIFVLVAHGIRSPPNIALCPETWRLVRKIPGLRTAMFSIFEPGKHLPRHRGPYNGVLRLHLGLLVPEPPTSSGIRIGPELRHWREGEVLIFDDAHEHEAWNETDRPRVVLFVDFLKPLKFPANVLNRFLLGIALFTPYVREGRDNLRRWEKHFHDRSYSE